MRDIYIHGGIGHQLFEKIIKYDQIHGDIDTVPMKQLSKH